jgi:hypothetical protein
MLTLLLQVDFAPTLAALLGVPTPYASIGRVSRGLWHLRGCGGDSDAQTCRQRYAAALQANAWQVRCSMLLQGAIAIADSDACASLTIPASTPA